MKCYVCGGRFSYWGFVSHVRREKRTHGPDIYKRLRLARRTDFTFVKLLEPSLPLATYTSDWPTHSPDDLARMRCENRSLLDFMTPGSGARG